jgi:hypothetical protein
MQLLNCVRHMSSQSFRLASSCLRCPYFYDAEVITICARRRVVDRDARSAQRRRTVLHLDPVGVTRGCQVLMDDTLTRARGPVDSIIIIVTTPNTHELLRVVTSVAVGAPEPEFALTVAPIAPEPVNPEVTNFAATQFFLVVITADGGRSMTSVITNEYPAGILNGALACLS